MTRGVDRSALRRWWLTLAAALYGSGLGIALATIWVVEAPPGQLPGAMLAFDLDARAPMRILWSLILSPFAAALLAQPLIRKLIEDKQARPWAVWGMGAAFASGLWFAFVDPYDPIVVLFIPLIVAAGLFLFRQFEPAFTSRDVILVAVGVTILAALSMLAPSLTFASTVTIAILATLVLRLATAAMQPQVPVAYCFVAAPATMLLLARFWIGQSALLELLVLAVVAISPFVLARMLRRPPRTLLRWLTYPAFALGLAAAANPAGAEGMLRLQLFEDGHWLMPANEIVRGEVPYRDVVPGHGMSDGLLEAISMKLGASNAGEVLKLRATAGTLTPVVLYALVVAMTGGSELALLTVLAAFFWTLAGTDVWLPTNALDLVPPVRALPAFCALALVAGALRRRSRIAGSFGAASALAAFSVFNAFEFGVYAFAAIAAATLLLPRPLRSRSAAGTLAGGAAAAALILLPLAAMGALPSFVQLNIRDYPRLVEVYALPVFHWPKGFDWLLGVPEITAGFFHPRIAWILLWFSIVAVTAAMVACRQRTSRVVDPLLAASAFAIVSAISFAERGHAYSVVVFIAVAAAAIYHLRRKRSLAAALIVAAIVIVAPTQSLRALVDSLQSRHVRPPHFVEYHALPRARGVWIQADNAAKIAAVQAFVERMPAGTTFFDFAHEPALYYLFDRPCPIRQYEACFYETPELQREVIARLESDRTVVAALMQFPNRGETGIDNVPDVVRAPIVAAYLKARFRPAYSREGVVFWVRRSDG